MVSGNPTCPGPVEPLVIADYHAISQPVVREGRRLVAIRAFQRDAVPHYLLADPERLTTEVTPVSAIKPAATPPSATTPYLSALVKCCAPPYRLENHGLTHAMGAVEGLFLTVDLCQSDLPLERSMFEAVAARGHAVPVAVAITGRWLDGHPEELRWLKEQATEKRLAITWVNHSDSHPYEPGVAPERNFLLTPGVDFRAEVLTLERKLLKNGLTPSVFFRFPGLVGSGAQMRQLRALGLIPLGSDAWLARGEVPQPGSIILIHGNGNEPAGIKLMMSLLASPSLPPLLPLAAAAGGGAPLLGRQGGDSKCLAKKDGT